VLCDAAPSLMRVTNFLSPGAALVAGAAVNEAAGGGAAGGGAAGAAGGGALVGGAPVATAGAASGPDARLRAAHDGASAPCSACQASHTGGRTPVELPLRPDLLEVLISVRLGLRLGGLVLLALGHGVALFNLGAHLTVS
jgi:hypothetical protein